MTKKTTPAYRASKEETIPINMSGTMAVISSNMQRTTFELAAMLPLNTPSRETIWISSKSIKLQKAAANIAL